MGRHAIHNLEDKAFAIIALYLNDRKSLREIARTYFVHPEIIKRLLSKRGISIRHRAEAMTIWHELNSGKK
jgi:predicted HTH domain antitoxin